MTKKSGLEKEFPGAHICKFWGKDILALVTSSPKDSITLEILVAALERLDNIDIYSSDPPLDATLRFLAVVLSILGDVVNSASGAIVTMR